MKPMPATLTPAQRVVAEVASKRGLTIGQAWPGFAVAAMFTVAVSTIVISYSGSTRSRPSNQTASTPPASSPLASASLLPASFEAAAIARHDHCCEVPAHRSKDVPQAPYAAIGSYLSGHLKHPVLAANLEREQWRFHGAAICKVSDIPAAHLVFLKDDGDSLSIFSLPASALPNLEKDQTAGNVSDHHAVVVHRQDGAVYCLVGQSKKGELRAKDLDNVLAAHLGEASVAAGGTGAAVAAGAVWVGRE